MKDPYILDNGVLKNKLGITSYDELKKAEADIGFSKLIDVSSVYKDQYKDHFDSCLICALHEHIFGEIFDWAGKYRTIPLYKKEKLVIPGLSLNYAEPEKIEKELIAALNALNTTNWQGKKTKELALEFAKKLAQIWRVHPFRDGNTRTTLAFAELFAREHGFPLDFNYLLKDLNRIIGPDGKVTSYSIRDKFVLAALDEKFYPEPEHLAAIFELAIENGLKKGGSYLEEK